MTKIFGVSLTVVTLSLVLAIYLDHQRVAYDFGLLIFLLLGLWLIYVQK